MKIARLSLPQGPRFAVVNEENGNYHVIADDPLYAGVEMTGQIIPFADAQLVSPMIPRSKVIGIGDNYVTEDNNPEPESMPTTFLKPNTAVIGPNVPIVIPPWAGAVCHEPELAVIISRMCKDIPEERAGEVIFGYTVADDVTDSGTQQTDVQWTRAKGFDTSCPLGPVMVTDFDPSDVAVTISVDGEVRGAGTTANLARPVSRLVALCSRMFTLLPGDIILTGTPVPAVAVEAGSDVVCSVEGIGELRNPVVADAS